mmetsp:Transcript_48552/g.125157  ORF Transcript_48552/g.125157 Transcript_48552/m.125157 type:complete len:246 (-) Transcript_48552:2418-3155(-)
MARGAVLEPAVVLALEPLLDVTLQRPRRVLHLRLQGASISGARSPQDRDHPVVRAGPRGDRLHVRHLDVHTPLLLGRLLEDGAHRRLQLAVSWQLPLGGRLQRHLGVAVHDGGHGEVPAHLRLRQLGAAQRSGPRRRGACVTVAVMLRDSVRAQLLQRLELRQRGEEVADLQDAEELLGADLAVVVRVEATERVVRLLAGQRLLEHLRAALEGVQVQAAALTARQRVERVLGVLVRAAQALLELR